MEDPTTIALNLTFFGTLGVAFVMFLGLFIVFVLTLVLAGAGRLIAVTVMALARLLGRSPSEPGTQAVKPVRAPRPAKREPQLSAEWAAAVARADARADARAAAAKAQAEDRPQAPARKAG